MIKEIDSDFSKNEYKMYKILSILRNVFFMLVVVVFVASCTQMAKNNSNKTGINTEVDSGQTEMNHFDKTMIFQASLEGNLQIVLSALNDGFNPNTVDENKRTALMLAAYNGNTEIVKLLIDKGADVNYTDEIQRTALMYASSGPFVNTVLILLQAGAKPNSIEKEENWTAAMMAAAEGQLEVLKELVAFGADLSMVDVDGESALDFAYSKGYSAVAEYIRSQQK
ncbi:MAG: ankyrin repeat domain-containing protein [Draconibacterium sp.]